MQEAKINPYLIVAIGVVSVSTSAIFVKLSSAEAGALAFYRLLFSVLLLLPVLLIKHRNELFSIGCRDWVFSIIAGIFWRFISFYGLSL